MAVRPHVDAAARPCGVVHGHAGGLGGGGRARGRRPRLRCSARVGRRVPADRPRRATGDLPWRHHQPTGDRGAPVDRPGRPRSEGGRSLARSRSTDQRGHPRPPRRVYVDCTARGVRPTATRPVFEPDRITLQYVTIGIIPWSSATLGMVEASGRDDVEKNRLCPPLTFTGDVADILTMAYAGMLGLATRAAERDVNQWTEACRLNPAAGAMAKAAQPAIHAALTRLVSNMGAALANTAQRSSANAIPAARKPEVAQQARVVAPGEEA